MQADGWFWRDDSLSAQFSAKAIRRRLLVQVLRTKLGLSDGRITAAQPSVLSHPQPNAGADAAPAHAPSGR